VTVQGPQCLPLERRLMANLQYVGARNVGVIAMSNEWNGVSMAREDFEEPGGHPRPPVQSHPLAGGEGPVSL
jgi:hypothetical protein